MEKQDSIIHAQVMKNLQTVNRISEIWFKDFNEVYNKFSKFLF